MLEAVYRLKECEIRDEDKDACLEKVDEISKEINNNILNKILN